MILALDFDGVMHPAPKLHEVRTQSNYVFCRQPLLEGWLREYPHVEVIISSSWREQHPLDEMQSYFSDDLQHRIIDATPVARKILGHKWMRTPTEIEQSRYVRQFEIERWMAQHAPGRPWVALDDEDQLFEPGCPNLILVDPKTGLKPGTIFRLTQRISKPRNAAELDAIVRRRRIGVNQREMIACGDIPQPWRHQFEQALVGSAVLPTEFGVCGSLRDWQDFLAGRRLVQPVFD